MKIIKVMNNSLVFTKDEKENELIVMGKGIGFMKKAGDEIDSSKIEKIFSVKDEGTKNKYFRVMEDIPSEYIEVVNNIVKYASDKLQCSLNDSIFISLVDHIAFAIERYNKNITLQNKLIWEVKKFYPEEFEVGKYALKLLNKTLSINLPEEEAGNIAFHIVNAKSSDANIEDTALAIKMMKDIINIIKYEIKISFNKDSLEYSRFITHLQFFLQRLKDDKMNNGQNNFILKQIEKQYPDKVKCARSIKEYVMKVTGKEITEDEILYLSMHLIRISS